MEVKSRATSHRRHLDSSVPDIQRCLRSTSRETLEKENNTFVKEFVRIFQAESRKNQEKRTFSFLINTIIFEGCLKRIALRRVQKYTPVNLNLYTTNEMSREESRRLLTFN